MKNNNKIRFKLLVMVLVMFGFGFALIPFYKTICEITGINILSLSEQKNNNQIDLKNTQVDKSRKISLELDANVHGGFKFEPQVRHLDVYAGEIHTVMYTVTNTNSESITAQAVPSYAPTQASLHFNKLECFCFKQQVFKPNEVRDMPVTFVISPKLPKNINTITLSYTFFSVAGTNQGVKVNSANPASSGVSVNSK
ncbi:MAG: Cytochrome c oxidase assembly protein CtaG [Pseudomonadota bacterium]|jgi:cytochrome c oxidase assembly protein subunit 11